MGGGNEYYFKSRYFFFQGKENITNLSFNVLSKHHNYTYIIHLWYSCHQFFIHNVLCWYKEIFPLSSFQPKRLHIIFIVLLEKKSLDTIVVEILNFYRYTMLSLNTYISYVKVSSVFSTYIFFFLSFLIP